LDSFFKKGGGGWGKYAWKGGEKKPATRPCLRVAGEEELFTPLLRRRRTRISVLVRVKENEGVATISSTYPETKGGGGVRPGEWIIMELHPLTISKNKKKHVICKAMHGKMTIRQAAGEKKGKKGELTSIEGRRENVERVKQEVSGTLYSLFFLQRTKKGKKNRR